MVQLEDIRDIEDLEIKSIEDVMNESPQPGHHRKWLRIEAELIERGEAPSLPAHLLYEYQFGNKSLGDLAKQLGVSRSGLYRLINNLGIPLRTMSESLQGERSPLYGKTQSEETRRKNSEAHRGEKNWNFGGTHSEETKRKISESNSRENHHFYNKKLSEEHKRKMSEAHRGEKNHNFNGWSSLKGYSLEFAKVMRDYVRERDNYSCQACGVETEDESPSVHHIDYDKDNDDEGNLISLCRGCHGATNPVNENRPVWTEIFNERIGEVYKDMSWEKYAELIDLQNELYEKSGLERAEAAA